MANKNEVKLIVTADTKGAAAAIQGFGSQLKSHWLELSAMAAGAFFTIRKIYTEFAAAAEREEKRMAFTNLAATFHLNADSIIADLKRMSGQSITTSRAIELAGKSMLSGLDPRAMPGLMEFAKTMTNVTGGKAADTFEDFTRAIITGQDRMLRMHGITVDFDKAQKDLATSLGGAKEQLNEQQIQYANLMAMLETASTMTQRLGGDIVSMADKLDKTSTDMEESLARIKDALYKTFGPPAAGTLKVFSNWLQKVAKDIDAIKDSYAGRAYQKIKEFFSPAVAEDPFGVRGKGITSVKNLGFTFDTESTLGPGLQSLKDYTEEMKASLGEIAKEEKDLTKEATNQIKDREAAYKNMYEALKFDTEKYYTFQKGLLEKQLAEEIAITGDLTLAWEAYYARLQELEEARTLRTNDFAGGIKAYYAELSREGFTWAQGAKDMMTDTASGASSSFRTLFQELRSGTVSAGDAFKNLGNAMLNSFSNAIDKMIADWLSFAMMTGIKSLLGSVLGAGMGGLSGVSGADAAGAGAWMGGAEGVLGVRGGPTGPRRIPGSAGTTGGGQAVSYSITIQNSFLDPSGIDKYESRQKRQIETTIKQLQHENKMRR